MDTIAPAWLWAFFVFAVIAALFVDFVVLKGVSGWTARKASVATTKAASEVFMSAAPRP